MNEINKRGAEAAAALGAAPHVVVPWSDVTGIGGIQTVSGKS